jgi:hypothetical protein
VTAQNSFKAISSQFTISADTDKRCQAVVSLQMGQTGMLPGNASWPAGQENSLFGWIGKQERLG